jgi:hypothetical protein
MANRDIYNMPSDDSEDDPVVFRERQRQRRHARQNPGATPLPPRHPSPPPPPLLYPELDTIPANASQTARAIAALPVPAGRTLDLRDRATLKGLDKGKANLEASLGQLRGNAPANGPCTRCARTGRYTKGPFKSCVVVPNQFDGACCNCRYNDDGSGCSLHRMYVPHFYMEIY